jgi:hypothetical protein
VLLGSAVTEVPPVGLLLSEYLGVKGEDPKLPALSLKT